MKEYLYKILSMFRRAFEKVRHTAPSEAAQEDVFLPRGVI